MLSTQAFLSLLEPSILAHKSSKTPSRGLLGCSGLNLQFTEFQGGRIIRLKWGADYPPRAKSAPYRLGRGGQAQTEQPVLPQPYLCPPAAAGASASPGVDSTTGFSGLSPDLLHLASGYLLLRDFPPMSEGNSLISLLLYGMYFIWWKSRCRRFLVLFLTC
jgi:hypothetical protein